MSENNQEKIIVRFAPSPTGSLHMGSVRTALHNYLFARKNKGKFLLRIEDTDKERSKKEYENEIIESLTWLGLNWDQEILRQSERTEIYKKKLNDLIKEGKAYEAEEQKDGSGKKVIRFKNTEGKIKFHDLIRGDIEEDVTDLGDFIIARNIEEPIYHFVVVVDDIESKVTHIIRGEDHISNTPRQILIARALGKTEDFKFAHLPLVLAEDKSKLSKRKHGDMVSLPKYRNEGYGAEAILNFLALIGWNPGRDEETKRGEEEKEIFKLDELIQAFDLNKVQKKSGVFNIEKLDWVNKQHLIKLSEEEKYKNFQNELSKTKFKNHPKLRDAIFIKEIMKIILDRIHRWGEVRDLIDAGEFDYFFEKPNYQKELFKWKEQTFEQTKNILEKISENINTSDPEGFNTDFIESISELANKEGKGNVFWPLRYSLSGKEKSPDPFTLLKILGREESAERIQSSIISLKNNG